MNPLAQKVLEHAHDGDSAEDVIRELLAIIETQREALARIQVYGMERQVKWENHLPGHPIVGICAEFGLLADKALTHTDEVLKRLGNGE